MIEVEELKISDPIKLDTTDIICLASLRSHEVEYGNFKRSQRNNQIIYNFDDKQVHSDTLPNIQYIIFPDQVAKPQDNKWTIGFSSNSDQVVDLLPITRLLDILDVDYKRDVDSIFGSRKIDILVVKTKTIEALSAIINLYAKARISLSLIFVLKEMVKWESSEIINAINTKVAGWLSIIEMDLSLKIPQIESSSKMLDWTYPENNKQIKVNTTDSSEGFYQIMDQCSLYTDSRLDMESFYSFYNLVRSNQQSKLIVPNNILQIRSEYKITCEDNTEVDPLSFIEAEDNQLYLNIERLVVDLRAQEMISKYSIEQLNHILAAKIHSNCYVDITKFTPEKKQYLEKFSKYVQAQNAEGSSIWTAAYKNSVSFVQAVEKPGKVVTGFAISSYDMLVLLQYLPLDLNSRPIITSIKLAVASLMTLAMVTKSKVEEDNIPRISILNEMACKVSLCSLLSNAELNDSSLERVAKTLNNFVNKYFAQKNIVFTNQTATVQLMFEQLSNQTFISQIGMDKYLSTNFKAVSGTDVPMLKILAYNGTECENYIANSLTGLSGVSESLATDPEVEVHF